MNLKHGNTGSKALSSPRLFPLGNHFLRIQEIPSRTVSNTFSTR